MAAHVLRAVKESSKPPSERLGHEEAEDPKSRRLPRREGQMRLAVTPGQTPPPPLQRAGPRSPRGGPPAISSTQGARDGARCRPGLRRTEADAPRSGGWSPRAY